MWCDWSLNLIYQSPHFWNPEKLCLRNPESGKTLLVESGIGEIFSGESGILGFVIRNPSQGIRDPSNDWIRNTRPSHKESGIQLPEIRNPQRGIKNPRLSWITLPYGDILEKTHEWRHRKTVFFWSYMASSWKFWGHFKLSLVKASNTIKLKGSYWQVRKKK